MVEKEQFRWWFDSHGAPRGSPWLQSTLAELDNKTKSMLKLIDEDADSFAQRAEMYYKKRPELINMVEDFYRAHRSLAVRFDQVKSDPGTRIVTTLGGSSSFLSKCQSEKISVSDQHYDCYSEICDAESPAQSEVEDLDHDHEDEIQGDETQKVEEDVSSNVENGEVMKLREEMEKLREENNILKGQLMQKDDEKREAIRQLSVAVEVLKDENGKLRTYIAKAVDLNRLKWVFLEKLFSGFSKTEGPVAKADDLNR
ncbi:protein NETWORKED 3C [Malania oleifera]|uniref:protein NETWORKED 3C n=1 Tax=Malania oleifera TaxID=397392 RepID=UPI0025AEAB80|nr:protein NETWORKED 3C [Malania oleifera]